MEIVDVAVHTLSLPAVERKAASTQDAAVIEVRTDEGVTGIGQAAGLPPAVVKAIVNAGFTSSNSMGLKEMLLGRDPFDRERLWQEMYEKTYGYGRRGAAISTISGVDIALWDVVGKVTGEPVYRLLGGGEPEPVRAYASTLFPEDPSDTEHVRREAERALNEGFDAVKFGWGGFGQDPELDERLVEAARETLGNGPDLMVDAGMAWGDDVKRAVKEIARLDEQFDLFWVEEPVYADNYAGYDRIASACDTRIVGGEREYTVYGFQHFLEYGTVDGIQPDVGTAGGITQLDQITSLAKTRGIPVYPHGYSTDVIIAATLHVIAANGNAPLVEYTVETSPIRTDLVSDPLSVEDGAVGVPDGPGLGVTLDRDVLEKYRVEPWTDW